MSGKFIKLRKLVVPTLTMLIIASQLTGCAVLNQKDTLNISNEGSSIVLEVPYLVDDENAEVLYTWVRLSSLETYPELRLAFDDAFSITAFGDGGKNGTVYVHTDGTHTNNSTLYYAMMNQKFRDQLADININDRMTEVVDSTFVDLAEGDEQIAYINAYFNLFEDKQENNFGGNDIVTRGEFLSALYRAENPVKDIEVNNEFLAAVDPMGLNEHTIFAQEMEKYSYLNIEDGSLNDNTFDGSAITRGEAIYTIVKKFYADEFDKVTGKEPCFSDAKDGGNIALKQGFITQKKDKETKEKVDPTCINTGMTNEIACTRCDYIEQEQTVIPALGHTNTDGDYYCDRCDVPYGDNVKSIRTLEDLINIKNDLFGFYQLENNIDLSNLEFLGIGDSSHPFSGYLYGNGYTIKGLNGYTLIYYNIGTIDSLIIADSTFKIHNTNDPLAVFAVYNMGTIKNCTLSGTINIEISSKYEVTTQPNQKVNEKQYNNMAGGFVAENKGDIINCDVAGTVLATFTVNTIHKHVFERVLGIPASFYNGEYAKLTHNITFGLIAGTNSGNVKDCKVKGNSVYTFNVVSKLHEKSDAGLAISVLNASIDTLIGKNTGVLSNNDINKEPTYIKNVPYKELGSSNLNDTGEKNVLNFI